jgi:outer membrane receptor protein involved in Fe transport
MSALLLASLLAVGMPLPATAQEVHAFNVSAQDPASAIRMFGAQAEIQILASADDLKGKNFNPVRGDISTEEALNSLLAGTGLDHRYVSDRAVALISNRPEVAVAAQPSASDTQKTKDSRSVASSQVLLAQAAPTAPATASPSKLPTAKSAEKPAQKPEQLEDVIVFAQKKTENLQDVPSSLTAISATTLENQGVHTFADYMTLVPSLSDFSEGAEGHGAIILRGLFTGFYQFSNTVGYYIDDTPFSATSPLAYGEFLTLDPDLSDIDHLEVLKGPQATLYGASTLGGLIKVVTKKPDVDANGGQVRVDGSTIDGGGSGYGLVGIGNVVLIPGELALRVSAFDRDTPGYMTNVTLNTRDRNNSRKEGGRIALRWVPSDNLEVELSAFVQSLFVNGWSYEFINLQTLQPLTGPYTYSLRIDPQFHTTYRVFNATINYKVGKVGTLTNSTSYASYSDHEQEDYSPWYGAYYNSFAPQPVPASAAQPLLFGPSLNKFTEELRFNSERIGAFEWLAGLFYTKEQIGYYDYMYNVIPPSQQPIPGPSGVPFRFTGPAAYREEAAFADLTYYFVDTLNLALGGRYSKNKEEVTTCQSGFAVLPGCVFNASSDSDFTWLAALNWRPTPGVSTYARVATSYRPGGPQLELVAGFPTSFKPDSLINYELGVKAEWLDNKLRTNLAVYDMDWKNVQLSESVTGGLLQIANGGKATIKGVELETRYVPIERLTVGVNVAYIDGKFDTVIPSVSAVTGAAAGDALPLTPKWSASAVADYVRPLGGTMTSNYGITYRYQGTKWSDYPLNPLNTGVVIPHYDTVDIRAGLNWSRYQLQARIANLFNSHGIDTVVDQRIVSNPPADAAIIPPRTFTLAFTVTF